MQLHKLVKNNYESAYRKMIKDTEMQDAKEEWIDKRADELIKNFSNENDWQIVELINARLENNPVDADIYNQFITDICYSQAKTEYKEKLNEWRF